MGTIYLAGAITGLSWESAEGWRIKIKSKIENTTNKQWICVNPCEHIPHKVFTENVERECMKWDLWKLKQCDIVVCDFSHPISLGTSWELGTAFEHNIPIIGVLTESTKEDVHPWWKIAAMHICDDLEDLTRYLQKHFLRGD